MALFTIDQEKCRRDGICAAECPGMLIELIGPEGFPTPVADAEERCINCGHCVSICPQGALSLKTMTPGDCLPVRKELSLAQEHCEHFLRSRRSRRKYKEKTVPRDILTRLIEVARYAPTASNSQPVHWLVFEDPIKVKRLAGLVVDWMRVLLEEGSEYALTKRLDRIVNAWDQGIDRILRSAPHLVVAHGSSTLAASQSSCILALAYLELAAPSFGLGTCWAGYFMAAANSYPPLQEVLALPPDHLPFGAVMIGYPKYAYQRMPIRNRPPITWR
ncbi:MAG: nitroreductase family protein [Deltaproteobacteria bacterium]|nr:nitroreductase family protein [Deltaproteobacteria bacterium]